MFTSGWPFCKSGCRLFPPPQEPLSWTLSIPFTFNYDPILCHHRIMSPDWELASTLATHLMKIWWRYMKVTWSPLLHKSLVAKPLPYPRIFGELLLPCLLRLCGALGLNFHMSPPHLVPNQSFSCRNLFCCPILCFFPSISSCSHMKFIC